MLENLIVKNIALIESAEINFNDGFNVLTGETGAGKSILLDSIGLILGGRADKSLIRSGENTCKVIGKFSLSQSSQKLYSNFCEKFGLEISDEVIVSRSFSIEGKGDIRINGEMAPLAMLKELSSFLVDSYMQNENQVLYNQNSHIKVLDSFAETDKNKSMIAYISAYKSVLDINKKLQEYGGTEQERANSVDLLRYQISEIDKAKLSVEEYAELLSKKQKMQIIGKIISNTTLVQNYLEQNAINDISRAKSNLEQASGYDNTLTQYSARLDSAEIEIEDILESIKSYNEDSDYREYEQQKVEDRLDLYNSLMRKYGKSVEEVLESFETYKVKLNQLENATEEINRLEAVKEQQLKLCYSFAGELDEYRKAKSTELSRKIVDNLKMLGMKSAKVEFAFKPIICNENFLQSNGMDSVELLFSANLGEDLKPLAKIASGGEISRFMLALKSVIASVDNMPTMIFDEIDTGISGIASEAVAKQMAVIGASHQVISVTHSGQIASMADSNFLIYKSEENGKTNTYIKLLSPEEKVNEIARFMSGEKLSQSAVLNAKELIEEQQKFKSGLKL